MKKLLQIDQFALRQFDPSRQKVCQQILATPEEFMAKANEFYQSQELLPGYAEFCKHLIIPNFTETTCNIIEITQENRHLLQSRYEARTEQELPVLRRFFPPNSLKPEKSIFLDIILYSKDQIDKESVAMQLVNINKDIDYEWGVISVKPQNLDKEITMEPITIMRNALGKEEGGSGVPLDRQLYKQAVEFWQNHAMLGAD